MDEKYDIFISYRRFDAQGNISGRDKARLIAMQLESEGYKPFFDYDAIRDNEFDKVIFSAIEQSKVFILLLTRDALNRCNDENDWVRREIEKAIESNVKIINVLPDGESLEWPSNLPESLCGIRNIHASVIHFGGLFKESINALINDRIVPVIPRRSRQDSHQLTKSLSKQFYSITKDLHQLTFKYREAINQGEVVDNEYFTEIKNLVKSIHLISEISEVRNAVIFEKSKSIVEHYNMFVDALRKQFTLGKEQGKIDFYANKSSKALDDFVKVVVEAMPEDSL